MNKFLPTIFLICFHLSFSLPLLAKEPAPGEMEKTLQKAIQKTYPAFVSIGGGSGIIISSDGYILTNHHVTQGVQKWLIVRPGGIVHRADLISSDPLGDIDLLKILDGKNLPYVELGDSDQIQPGQPIFALGNPWVLAGPQGHPTVTVGIISALHRYQGGYGDAIQMDASINPGNSGGPTFDLHGRLIGINGQIRPRFGRRTFTGIGLAIPINQIKNFLPVMKKGGDVTHGFLPKGLKFADAPLPQGGVEVLQSPGSPFQKGDIVLELGGYKPINHNRIQGIISTFPSDSKIPCKILREGKPLLIEVVIEKIPTYAECQAKGIPFRFPSHPYLGLDFGENKEKGVIIVAVIEDSPADKAGIIAGDIVLTFNSMAAEDQWSLRSLLSGSRFGEEITLEIKRGSETKTFKMVVGNTDDYPIKRFKSQLSSQPQSSPSTQPTQPSPGEENKGVELSAEILGFSLGEEEEDGIPVSQVRKGSVAEKNGFLLGDKIVKFNGEVPQDSYDLENKLRFANSKEKLKFEIRRETKDSKGQKKILTINIELIWK